MNGSVPVFDKVYRLIKLLASPSAVFFVLPWMMVLVVLGTVAQKQMSIYDVTHIYFSSIILWLGPIPTPGGLLTIGIFFVSLLLKFLFFSTWSWQRAGTILTHFGVLLLLLGGLVTAILAQEGFMVIDEEQVLNHYTSYHDRELVVERGGEVLLRKPFDNVADFEKMTIDELSIEVLLKCDNCGAQAPSGQYTDLRGLAQNMELTAIPSNRQKEANLSGLILKIGNQYDPSQSGTYMLMEDIPRFPILKTKLNDIHIKLQRVQTKLPFSFRLDDFKKIDYLGTNKAREYESYITVREGVLSWPVVIRMNEPFRYRGYTFYQSSFDQRPDLETTVLSVVENKGQLFPYISTTIMFLGLLLQVFISLGGRSRKKGGA